MELITFLQSFASPALDSLMLLVTNLGSEAVYIAAIVVIYTAVDARRGRALALLLLASFYANQLLKLAVASQRPFQVEPDVLRSAAAAETAPGHSFPSGHAQGAATFWGQAAAYVRRRWFTLLAAAVVLVVSLTRLYLGVHFPIDVLGGWAVAAALVALALWLELRRVSLSRGARIALGAALPLAFHLVLPTDESGLLLGSFAAFAVGPELVRFEAGGPLRARALLALLALALVFAALFGSSAALSEDVKRLPLVSFSRYLVIGGLVTIVAPLLGRALRLVPASPGGDATGRAARPR